jgi:hypothetical protein
METNFESQIVIGLSDGDDTELILMKDGLIIVGTEQGFHERRFPKLAQRRHGKYAVLSASLASI